MTHKIRIEVANDKMDELNALLEQPEIEGYQKGEAVHVESADFGDGYQVDIKLCNGNSPYVDAVLFRDGLEVDTAYAFWISAGINEFNGEYCFFHNGDEFFVSVEYAKSVYTRLIACIDLPTKNVEHAYYMMREFLYEANKNRRVKIGWETSDEAYDHEGKRIDPAEIQKAFEAYPPHEEER